MAYVLETLRSEKIVSIHGRRLALDADDFLIGPKGLRHPITEDIAGLGSAATIAASGTGTTLANHGLTRIVSSAGSSANTGFAFTLQAPKPGVRKSIFQYGASTSAHVIGFSGSAVVVGGSLTSAGSTMISIFKQNASVELVGLTTAVWLQMNSHSSLVSSDHLGISYTATASS